MAQHGPILTGPLWANVPGQHSPLKNRAMKFKGCGTTWWRRGVFLMLLLITCWLRAFVMSVMQGRELELWRRCWIMGVCRIRQHMLFSFQITNIENCPNRISCEVLFLCCHGETSQAEALSGSVEDVDR